MRDAEPGTDHCPAIYDGPISLCRSYIRQGIGFAHYMTTFGTAHRLLTRFFLTRESFVNEFSQRIHLLSEYIHWGPPSWETNVCEPY
jgi:hypothetical protein